MNSTNRQNLMIAMSLGTIVLANSSIFAASQTWATAPVDNSWINLNNWVGGAVPGALNSTTTGDIATFNSPITAGIGGAGNPIVNDVSRGVRGLLFDSANCGAYVFGNGLGDNSLEIIHLGNITMAAPVLNPVNFKQALQFRVPVSTNGRYGITNNAATSDATLFFAAVTNTAINTRSLSMFLGGSNTGTNTIVHFDDLAGVNGAIHLDKVGSGRWILSGFNDLPQKSSGGIVAGVLVQDGTLEVRNPGSLGSITVNNLAVTNATLQIDGVTLNNDGITLRNGGNIRMDGSGTVNGVTVGSQPANNATLSTTGSGDVMTVGIATPKLIGGAADTVLHVAGPGTVSLGFDATYVGKWSIDAGTLSVMSSGGLGTGANLHVAAGGTLDVTPLGSGAYTLGTAALSASGTGTAVGSSAATIKAAVGGTVDLVTGSKPISLVFTPTVFVGDTLHPSLYMSQGTLALGANAFAVNNASGTPLGAGTYRLIEQASGNVVDGGGYTVAVVGSGLSAGYTAAIEVAAGNVNLTVTALAGATNCCDGCTTNNYVTSTNTISPGFNYLAINLCHGTNNSLNDLLAILQGDAASQQLIFSKWNFSSQSFEPALTYYGPTDAGDATGGWYYQNGNPASETLAPGEGFKLENTSGAAFNFVERGCPPTCPPPCLPTNGCSLVGRLGIGTALWTNLSSCPPVCGTRVTIYTGTVSNNYDYVNGNWSPQQPALDNGKSAFVCVLVNSNCVPCTNGLSLVCVPNKSVERGSEWAFDLPAVFELCCTNATVTVFSTVTNGSCPQVITRTWLANDGCGNSNSCSQTVTVVDTTPPVLTCASNKTAECGSAWAFDPPSATDAGSGTNLNFSVISTATNGACPWIVTRTWQVTDECSNSAVCTQSVTLNPPAPCVAGETWIPRETDRVWLSLASSADGSKLAAVANGGQIYTSTDSGATWTPRESNRNWWAVASSADGTKLVAGGGNEPIYTSSDSGVTWTPHGSAQNWVSVASSVDGSKLVGGSWGGTIYTSTDSGVTWTSRESNRFWWAVASSADGSKLAAVVNGGQIYTSTDSGVTWTPRESTRSWFSIASSADGNKLVAAVKGGQIYTSTDSGATWTPRETYRSWFSVASSADGSKLVAGAWGGQLYISADFGLTWTPRENYRAWRCVNSSADGSKLVGGAYDGQIYTSVCTPALALTCATSKTVECGQAWSFDPPSVMAPCCPDLQPTILSTETNGSCPQVITRTWLVTGCCSNTAACSQTVTVLDTTPPVFTNCPPATLDLGCNPTNIPDCNSGIGATDTCGTPTVICARVDATNGCVHTRTITYTAFDVCGNSNTCAQVIAWTEDITPPVLTGCTNRVASSLPGTNGAVVFYTVTALDNCDGVLPVSCVPPSGSFFPIGTSLVTCTAVDNCGNTNSCSHTVTVQGSTNSNCCGGCPTNSYVSYKVVVEPGFNFFATALCGGTNTLSAILNDQPDNTTVYKWDWQTQDFDPNGATYIASSGEWSPDLTLAPGEGFALVNSANAYTNTFFGCEPHCPLPCGPTNNACQILGALGIGTNTWTNLYSCPPTCGTTLGIWNVGNQDWDIYTFLNGSWLPNTPYWGVGLAVKICVQANVNCLTCTNALSVVCPTNKTVECGAVWAFDSVTASNDCCGSNNITITIQSTVTNGTCPRIFQRVWQITDCFTNMATCTQTVTVVDTTPPVIACSSTGQNLVPNPSFEDHTGCPFDFSQINLAPPWFRPTQGTPDYFNDCATWSLFDVPANGYGDQAAHTGQAYAGGHMVSANEYREYIEAPLVSPLLPGHTYKVSFYVALADYLSDVATDNLGAYLSAGPLTDFGINSALPVTPQVRNTAGVFLSSFSDWMLVQGTFTAAGGETHITIGNFYNTVNTPTVPVGTGNSEHAYYFVDDVSVEEICAAYVTNKIINCGTAWSFDLPVAVDSCSGTNVDVTVLATVTNAGPCSMVMTRTWLLSDLCGNTNTCSQTVTVVDTTPPVFTGCPTTSILLPCNSAPTCATLAALGITASDECSGNITPVCTAGPVVPGGNQNSQTFTLTATDACTNSATCQVTYTWPVNCATSCCDSCTTNNYISYTVIVHPGANYLVNHLCHGTNNSLSEVLPNVPDGSTLQKWNPAAQNFTQFFYDSGAGGWVDINFNPISTTLQPGAGFILFNPDTTYTNTFYGCEPTCPPPCLPTNGCVLVGRLGIGTAAWTNLSSCPPQCGTEVRIWNGTGFNLHNYQNGSWTPPLPALAIGQSAFVCWDGNTNCLTCTNALSVVCPTNKTVECGAVWAFDSVTASNDCCGSNNITITIQSTVTNGTCPRIFQRVWQITDCFTNMATCTQTVTVVDTTPPVFTAPSGPGTVTPYTDRSPWEIPSASTTTINFSTLDNGNPITDPSSDQFLASFTRSGLTFLNVRSYWNSALYVGAHQPIHIDLPPGTFAFGAAISPFHGGAGNTTITLSTGDVFVHPAELVAWTEDFFGVVSTTPVAWVEFMYDNDTLFMDDFSFSTTTIDSGFAAPTAVDDCCTNVNVTLLNAVTNGLCPKVITLTWQATDCCGNTATTVRNVTEPGTAPFIITCGNHKTVQCGTLWNFDEPNVVDACCTNFTVTPTTMTNSGPCPLVITRTWLVSDACGNSNTCSQTVTVVDTTPPVLTCVGDKTVECCSTNIALLTPAFTVLKHFSSVGTDGSTPRAGLHDGGDDFLYGTTYGGGDYQQGTVYKVHKNGSGSGFMVLHSFGGSISDGQNPSGALVEDSNGTLYGCTDNGSGAGAGTIFKIEKNGSGYLKLKAFSPPAGDGRNPATGPIIGSDGDLYGTTRASQSDTGSGTVWKLGRTTGIFTVLHEFPGYLNPTSDGQTPWATLMEASDGRLYGATLVGGSGGGGRGTVFTLTKTPGSGNDYDYKVLVNFAGSGSSGERPYAALFEGADHILYGTTRNGGILDRGTIFKLERNGLGGDYTVLTYLKKFPVTNTDGAQPFSPVLQGLDGALYGTTYIGGSSGYGTIFRMNPDGSGFTVLKVFNNNTDGRHPFAGLIQDSAGVFYGTAENGNGGVVFKLELGTPCSWTFDPPTATDACCTNLAISVLNTVTNGSLCSQNFSRTWQATDCCGNTSTCTQTVTVVDTTPPVITGCANITITLTNGHTSTLVNYPVAATDTCSSPVTLTCTPSSGSVFYPGVTPVTCVAVDACGNTNICQFNVKVIPAINCPDLVVHLNAIYPGPKLAHIVGPDTPCCGSDFTYHINYGNHGNVPVTGATIQFLYPQRCSIVSITSACIPPVAYSPFTPNLTRSCAPPFYPSPGLETFTLPTLNPGDACSIRVKVHLCCDITAACASQTSLVAQATILPPLPGDCTPANNVATFSRKPCCSHDPNDCTVSPVGCGPEGFIPGDQALTYLIQFQNEGGGTANEVGVQDFLDENLDLSTLEILASSHPYVFEQNGRELLWIFHGIDLPSQNIDEEASRGFVEFRVRPLPNLPVGAVINNGADIYFDANPAVTTITTTNTITASPVPFAAFSVSPQPGSPGSINNFSYTGGTPGATQNWDFGADAIPQASTQSDPSGVIFSQSGPHLVSLTTSLGDCNSEPAVRMITVGQPQLYIVRSENGWVLYWMGDGYLLQETDSLEPGALWNTMDGPPADLAGWYYSQTPDSGNRRFYRLIKSH